ncbi:MAG: DEAD/DEAH box helicase [Erysipelotrichaceae bacterium]
MKKFNHYDIEPEILKALDKMGYDAPTDVQRGVIDDVLDGNDVLVQSKTGSGKTASFAIPLIARTSWEANKPQALILTPTRELAMQVKDECFNIGLYKRLHTIALFGRSPISNQIKELKQKTHLVVGTPGRVIDHLERGTLDLSEVKYFVLDEADEMLKMGFIDQVEEIMSYLPKERVTALFSATMPERIVELAHTYLNDAKEIVIEDESQPGANINHGYYTVTKKNKVMALEALLSEEYIESAIVFANMQEVVEDVYEALLDQHVSVARIHGGLLQKERTKYLEGFRNGTYRVLVATDVAARGIDVEKVSLVVHYDFPLHSESYIHRSGRSGRMNQSGTAISLIERGELERLDQLEVDYPYLHVQAYEIKHLMENEINLEHLMHSKKVENKKKDFQKAEVCTLYFGAGKNKKMRAKDLLGAILEIEGVAFEDIGRINIKDTTSYVDVLNQKGDVVLTALQKKTIKGKQVKVEKAKG